MKKIFGAGIICTAAIVLFAVTGCNKEASSNNGTGSSTSTTAASAVVIAVAASTTSTDSVYIMQQCSNGQKRDSISAANLPAEITTYLDSNYAGYSFNKAFAVTDSTGAIQNYAVVIFYNNKPVGLLFSADGSFIRVLEQREPGDMHNDGWHQGGRFCNRDSLLNDTVALANLPVAVTTYLSTNYPGDTLLKAFKNADSGYVVISADNGLFATVFTASGSFVKRAQLPEPPGKPQPVAQSTLPATVLSYLTTTYPSYVFDKAFSVSSKGTLKGYVVFVDANNTKYAVVFNAAGSFVAATTLW